MAGRAFEVALGAVARLVGGAHRVVGAEAAQVEGAAQVGVEVAALLDEAAQSALSLFGRLVDPLPDRAQLRQALLHRAGRRLMHWAAVSTEGETTKPSLGWTMPSQVS